MRSDRPAGEPQGSPRVLALALAAFSLGFGVWAMFAALGPFLIDWYDFGTGQVMFLAAVEPLGAMALSIPLGIVTDRYGGRIVLTAVLALLSLVLLFGLVADSYLAFLAMGVALGLGGATFVVGNAHVSAWYPKARQGTALGIFALGNAGVVIGMVTVPLLVSRVFGGRAGSSDPPAVMLGPIEGWRLIFLVFAAATGVMAFLYWKLTSDPPGRSRRGSAREITAVLRSSRLAWVVAYLYWVSFGALTFFSASTPTYLVDRFGVDPSRAATVFASILVVCVAAMRPLGGWLSDRHDPLRLLTLLFAATVVCSCTMVLEISLAAQLAALYGLALASGAAAACVVKLIPTYFAEVGAVSGLAKAAGAACGFTMTSIMALSTGGLGTFAPALAVWALMNVLALWVAAQRLGFPGRAPRPQHAPVPRAQVAPAEAAQRIP